MARRDTNTDYTAKREFTIYVLIHPSKMLFYIGKTPSKSLRTQYKDHKSLKFKATKNMFQDAINTNKLPMMYPLEIINTTKTEAFNHQIVWTKYFMSHGYTSTDTSEIIQYSNDLSEENQALYSTIENKKIENICNTETRLFADYGQRRKQNNTSSSHQITIKLREEEYQTICKNAKKAGQRNTSYCKNMALNARFVNIDYNEIRENTREISQLRTSINDITLSIMKTGECYEAEVKMLLELFQKILDIEKQTLKIVAKQSDKLFIRAPRKKKNKVKDEVKQ